MKNIVLYAPPAAGKGTECELLTKDYGYEVLSIGQVLRNARNPETEVGRQIIETQDKGILTPDNIVAEALKEELTNLKGKNIIIEGYPRNIEQTKLLDSIFSNYIVINIDVKRDIAMKRTLGRVTCKNCNKIYNIYFPEMKPKQEGICDICGEILEIRSDDKEQAFTNRYDVYESNAPQILDYYRKKGILHIVDGNKDKNNTHEQIVKILNEGKND